MTFINHITNKMTEILKFTQNNLYVTFLNIAKTVIVNYSEQNVFISIYLTKVLKNDVDYKNIFGTNVKELCFGTQEKKA